LAYVKKLGSTKSERCNDIARQIWQWAEDRDIWINIAYIPGKQNILADDMSRKFKDHLEWSLAQDLFEEICTLWGTPEVDLFASRLNNKLQRYVSWHPEPLSWKVDAFTFPWVNNFFYVFPPFRLVSRVARKMILDKTKGILIAPLWNTQPWFPRVKDWVKKTKTFPRRSGNLQHQGPLLEQGDVNSTPLVAFFFYPKP
jgi:hypothetical protein